MICPYCDTINHDDAKVCRSCNLKLPGRNTRPEDDAREKKYLRVGIAAVAAMVLFLTVIFTLSSCICSGCVKENAGEEVINEDVGGSYFDDTVSESDFVSGGDVSGADVSAADVTEDASAEE